MKRWHRRTRFGFTILELLVVFSVLFILAAVGVPAVRSVLRSQDRTSAVNQLRIAVAAARDAALRNEPGRDAAVVFFFNPGGQVRAAVYSRVGSLSVADASPGVSTPFVPDPGAITRDVFVPEAAFEPISLPGDWAVRGYAPPGTVDRFFYEDTALQTGEDVDPSPRWVFPETGFFFEPDDPSSDDGGRGGLRQTFMVRFAGGTGTPVANGGETLVVAPSPSRAFRDSEPFASNNLLAATDVESAVVRVLTDPTLDGDSRQALLGDVSSDTVLARPVPQIILYDRRELAAFLGVRLNRATNALYVDPGTNSGEPELSITAAQADQINVWLENRTVPVELGASEKGARLFAVSPTPGGLVEVLP